MSASIGHNSQRNQNVLRANPDQGFTKLSNVLLRDSRLSYETRGLLAELLSRPDDWEITVAAIVKSGPAGRDKVYRMMKEAEKFGYASSGQERQDGLFQKQRYRVTDDPKLLIERAAAEILSIENSVTENPEAANPQTVVPFPAKPFTDNTEANEKRLVSSASWKSGSGLPFPEKPQTVLPLTENQTGTNKREELTNEVTKGDALVRDPAPRDSRLGMVATAIATGIAVAALPAAAAPIDPPAQVRASVAECWQTPKAQMDAATNVNQARAQRQVWVTPNGLIEVAGDFRAELEAAFPMVDLLAGLSAAAPNVKPERGALDAMQAIRRQFGYMRQDAVSREEREKRRMAAADARYANKEPDYQKFYDGAL